MPPLNPISLTVFQEKLCSNISKRSRTLEQGKILASVEGKPTTHLNPEEVRSCVLHNLTRIAEDAWHTATEIPRAEMLEQQVERWYDLLNCGVVQDTKTRQNEKSKEYRYRSWEVHYSRQNPRPEGVGLAMATYYSQLGLFLSHRATYRPHRHAALIGWSDYMMDQIIHPWKDGCGRLSTILVMYLCLVVPGATLPTYGDRATHHNALKTGLKSTLRYYKTCLLSN